MIANCREERNAVIFFSICEISQKNKMYSTENNKIFRIIEIIEKIC